MVQQLGQQSVVLVPLKEPEGRQEQVERVVHDETPPPPTAAQAAAVDRYFATHDVDAEAIPTLAIPGAEAVP